MVSSRQLRRMERRTKKEIIGRMRADLKYLIKPKPKFLPHWLWLKILRRLLRLDFNK